MKEFLNDEFTVTRTAKCGGAHRIQAKDELDDVIIDVVRESPHITIAEAHRRVVRLSRTVVSLSTLRYRLYSLEQEGILSSQKSRNGVYFHLTAEGPELG